MLRTKNVLGALALVLMASLVSAQDQPSRGRRGGFGGPGGMMGSPVGLLRMPEVRKELSLTEEQNKQVEAALEQANPGRGGFGGQQDLSQEERQKRMEEMRKKMDEATASVKKVLTPEQNKRLEQLTLQRQGAGALARPEVAKQLGLSDEQKEKIAKIQESTRVNFRELSDEERQKAFAEMPQKQEKARSEILALLTDDQKAKWSEMKGKEFTFPQFGGPGGGPGGRPGGAGGQRQRPATKDRQE